jgi:hypothetical protein
VVGACPVAGNREIGAVLATDGTYIYAMRGG